MLCFCVVCCRREPDEIKPDSLPAIRLLMREMEVAVREEDYEQAARLRDHPWMRLAEDINMHRWGGGRMGFFFVA
jgi:hypothetical protein